MTELEEMVWVERYRPKTIAETILPKRLKIDLQALVDKGRIPNILLAGPQGMGKTTVARALCEQLEYDYIIINGSTEGRLIDTVRSKITQFASSVSFDSNHKCIIIDEADNMPQETTQAALRAAIEEFSDNCSFIFTGNFKARLMGPMLSRFSNIDFFIPKDELPSIAGEFFVRVKQILDENDIKYDAKVVAALISKFCPDWRRCLNEFQRFSASGVIDDSVLASVENQDVDVLINAMRVGDFKSVRTWVFTSQTIDLAKLVRDLDNKLYDIVDTQSVPGLILVYADYQHRHVMAMDPQINVLAMLVEVMATAKWKPV